MWRSHILVYICAVPFGLASDSQAALKAVKRCPSKSTHLRRLQGVSSAWLHKVTQKLEEVTLEWIPGEDNVADLFTKRMQLRKFIKRLALLGVDYRLGCIDGPLSGKRLPCGKVMSLPAERMRHGESCFTRGNWRRARGQSG